MTTKRWPQETRDQALQLWKQHGPAETARQTGVPYTTVCYWARKAGLTARHAENNPNWAAAQESRRLDLADRLHAEANQILDQLHEPTVVRKAMNVSDGANNGSHVEIVDIELDKPTFAEQKSIMTAAAIAIDKMQILTGEATERTETKPFTEADARDLLGDNVVDMAYQAAKRANNA